MRHLELKQLTKNVLLAVSAMCAVAPVVVQAQQATDLGSVGATGTMITITGKSSAAENAAPSQGMLDARSAESVVGDQYVRDFESPVADFSQTFLITPGAFSYSPTGVGLGNAGTVMRGLTDSQYLVTFDGIPFNDTNGVSHHSYTYFPTMAIGGAVVDRSPGTAATIGQATFGGSLNLLSRNLEDKQRTSVTASAGTWGTDLFQLEHETGWIGENGSSNLLMNIQQMKSDGYYTLDPVDRTAMSTKFEHMISPDTMFTGFFAYERVRNNLNDFGAPSRQDIALYGNNFMNVSDPSQLNYQGYNVYDVSTTFGYVDWNSNLGGGWKIDEKLYNYSYHNQQNIGGYGGALPGAGNMVPGYGTAAGLVSNKTDDVGIDKLNAYHTSGSLFRATDETTMGTLRTGLWAEYANSFRHQTNMNDLTQVDMLSPRFSENYQTYTLQPYVEFEFKVTDDLKITPGVKYAQYTQNYDHFADLKKVGPLGGTVTSSTGAITGGLPDVTNEITYRDWLPTLDIHYMVQPNWSAYAQFAAGDLIPPTSVFDYPFANTTTPPKIQKSTTVQFGTVWKSNDFTTDFDVFHVKLDNSYNCYTDPNNTSDTICAAAGTEVTQGVEWEGTYVIGGGFSAYANASVGTTKYDSGLWVPGAPSDVETLSLMYKDSGWDTGLIVKRVGKMYNNGATPNAYTIDPITLTNLFLNYTIKNPWAYTKQAKFQVAVNNLTNIHSITGISGNGSDSNPLPADAITTVPSRSVAVTMTLDF
ncbi:MAG: TonB-dependent receptor plug domain-containing protein [Burkholderiaceae bacterium]|nr:TonB-dependent receptor plug domain-containing protein [Burkholderiaceae bacterium]